MHQQQPAPMNMLQHYVSINYYVSTTTYTGVISHITNYTSTRIFNAHAARNLPLEHFYLAESENLYNSPCFSQKYTLANRNIY